MSRIFLSHSSADSRAAVAVKQWLVEQDPSLDDDIFLDLDPDTGIGAGVRWKDALIQASDRCEAVVCLLSKNWRNSSWCVGEFRAAELHKKQIFSARLEDISDSDPTSDWQHVDLFGSGPQIDIDIGDDGPPISFIATGLRRLRDGLWAAGIGAQSFPWPPADEPDRAPYRGWEPFEPVDAGVFFGRDTQILRATEALREMRILRTSMLFVVLGPSGAGKSSFLRAGVLPRLRKDDRSYVVLDVVRPERNVLTGESGLAQAIWDSRTRLDLTGPSLGDIRAACVAGDARSVGGWLQECQDAATTRMLDGPQGEPPTLLLPLDQAEELFSTEAGDQATVFMTMLRDLADAGIALIVTVTIRTDRYEVMQTAPELAGVGSVVFDQLKPMRPTQFKEVITGPAVRSARSRHRFTLDDDLVERLLSDAGGGADGGDALPLLSLTLARLYHDYGSTGRITLAPYDAGGGMASIVQTEIDDLLSGDPDVRARELALLRSAFVPWLATVNPINDQPLRRVARWADLPPPSRPLVERLVGRRLLVSDVRDGERVVEVALESLFRQWADLAGWLREHRDDLKAADNVERNAEGWRSSGRDESWLLAGTRLAEAEKLTTAPGFAQRLTPAADYLAASRAYDQERVELERQHHEAELQAARERAAAAREKQKTAEEYARVLRRRSRVLRVAVAVAVVVALVAAAGFVYAMVARGQAQERTREARALQLVQEARAMLSGTLPGSDVAAFQGLLAAAALSGHHDDAPLLEALLERPRTLKIMPTAAGVSAVAYTPDGRRFAAALANGTVRQWNSDRTAVDTPLDVPATPAADYSAVSYDPDGSRLVVGRRDGRVLLFDADSGARLLPEMYGHRGTVVGVAVSHDRIVSAGADRTVRVWNARTGRQVADIDTGSQVFGLAVDPAGRFIASAGADGVVRLWDFDTHRLTREFKVPNGSAMSVAISAAGPGGAGRIAAGDARGVVRMWSLAPGPGNPVVDFAGHTDAVMSLAFNPAGDRLVSGGVDQTVRLWNVGAGRPIGDPMAGHHDTVWGVAFSPDGHTVISGAGIDDKSIRIWNADTPQPVSRPVVGNGERFTGAAFSPDGGAVVSGGSDHAVRMWDTDTGQPLGDPALLPGVVNATAFSPAGDRVGGGSADGTVGIWPVVHTPDGSPGLGTQPALLHTDGAAVLAVAFSARGDRLAAATADGSVWVWDADTLELIRHWPNAHRGVVFTVAFSPDGDQIASGGVDGQLRIWDVDGEAPGRPPLIGPPGVITGVAFGPDGTLATAGTQAGADGKPVGVVRLWDVAGRRVLAEHTTHSGLLASVAVSPDGGRLATGGFDRFVTLWRVAPGRTAIDPIGDPLPGHDSGVASVAFSSRGDHLVSSSSDGTLRLWTVPAASDLSRLLCDKLTENMDPAEWRRRVQFVDYVASCPGLPVAGG